MHTVYLVRVTHLLDGLQRPHKEKIFHPPFASVIDFAHARLRRKTTGEPYGFYTMPTSIFFSCIVIFCMLKPYRKFWTKSIAMCRNGNIRLLSARWPLWPLHFVITFQGHCEVNHLSSVVCGRVCIRLHHFNDWQLVTAQALAKGGQITWEEVTMTWIKKSLVLWSECRQGSVWYSG